MKKSLLPSLVAVCTTLAVITATPAFGGNKKKKATPAYHTPVISSVMGKAITVSEEKTTRTFIITQFTDINVNRQKANIVDLKPGMKVEVTNGKGTTHPSPGVATRVPD